MSMNRFIDDNGKMQVMESSEGKDKMYEGDQPAYYQNLYMQQAQYPQPDDYYKYYQHPAQYQYSHGGYCFSGNDCIQVVRPNIININNVNAMGNALIISGTSAPAAAPAAAMNMQKTGIGDAKRIGQEEGEMAKERTKKEGEGFFKITVDFEFYQQKYADPQPQ